MAFKKKAIAKEVQQNFKLLEDLPVIFDAGGGIQKYDEIGFARALNESLRDLSATSKPLFDYSNYFAYQRANALQSDLMTAKTQPQITYRGLSSGSSMPEKLAQSIGLNPDTAFFDRAFMATTPSKAYASSYGADVYLRVLGGSGYKMPTRGISSGGEVLYPAGNLFDVENYRRGDWAVTATLVDRNLSPKQIKSLKTDILNESPDLFKSFQESSNVDVGSYNSNLFEYGQKFVDKKTGDIKSLDIVEGNALRLRAMDGTLEVLSVDDLKNRYEIKAPSDMKSFNQGDGLISNASDLRYTVLGDEGDYVRLEGLRGDTTLMDRPQLKKGFRANTLGFGTFPAITSGLLGTTGIIGGATAGKLLAKSLGANEDQQNIAAGIGGAIGGLTGVTTGYIGEGATMPKSFQEMAKRAIGVRANSEAGAFYPANPEIMQRQADRLKAKGYTDAKLESFDPMKGWYEALVDDVKTNYTSDFGATRDRLNSQLADKSISLDRPNPEIEARLIDASNRLNVPVTNSDKFKDNRLGVQKTAIDPTSPTGFKSRIVINNNLANGRAYSPTLAHELGHYVLKHGETQLSTTNFDGLSVPLNEVQAEAVSYGVMKKLGLADNPKLSEIGDLRKNYIGAYANKLPSPILLDASQNLVEDAVNQIIPESTESLKLIRGERTQLMANKKINDGSVSSSVKEPKPQKLTTDTLYKYLQMMGGEPVIVKPDGKQATKGKFAFGQDIGLNNEFTKLPEIHTRFDDPKIASMVAKELATGELTVGMQRNPETGEVETMTKRFEPIPSRGNTQLRRYKLQNDTSGYVDPETKKWVDTSGTYLAFNKPEEAYKAPKSLKELQREARSQQFQLDSAYKELNVSPDMSKRDYLSAIKPRMAELEANEPLRQQAKLVLDDIVSRVPAAPDPQSSQLTQYVKQAAIASEPQQLLNSARDTGGWANAVGESYDVSRSQPEPTFKNLEPRFRAEMGNFLNPTGLSDRAAYDRAKTGYEGYQDLGYAPKDKSFPDFYDLQRQSKAEGVRPEAFQNYIKGKQNAPLIESGVIAPPELPMTARLGQEYISPKTGNVGTVESVGKKGVKLNVDGQVVPVEYTTLEKLKYTGNKGYGFTTPAALRPVLGAFAGGTVGSTVFKQIAQAAGLNEDQQNAAAATGGLIGSFTGSALTNLRGDTNLRLPTPQEFAKTMMSAPQQRSAGARLFDLASSESGAFSVADDNPFKGAFNFDDSDPFSSPENTIQKATSSEVKAKLANIAPDVRAKIDNFRNFPEPITRFLNPKEELLGIARYDLPDEGSTSGVNRPLRGQATVNDADAFYDSAVAKRFAVTLQDDLLSASTKSQVTYRGIDVYGNLLDKIGLKPNRPFYDKGFMSTSPDPNIVRTYGDGSALEVMGKAGYRLPTQHNWMGGEVLYPAGNQFDVENYRVDDSGKVTARLVDRNLTPNEVADLKKQAYANAKSSSDAVDKAFQASYTLGAEGFEYGQKFVSPKGGAASLVDSTDPSSLMFQTLDGKTVYVDQKQFDRLEIKPPATLTDLKRGDGLIANKSDQRYTVLATTDEGVKLRGEDGTIKTARKSQVPELFRANSLGFTTYPVLNTLTGVTAGGLLGYGLARKLAKDAGLNEDQQNLAGIAGGVFGGATGGGLGLVPTALSGEWSGRNAPKFKMPSAKEFATNVLFGNPLSERRIGNTSERGAFYPANPEIMQRQADRAKALGVEPTARTSVEMNPRTSTGAIFEVAPKSLSDLQKQRAKLDTYNPDAKPVQAVKEFKPVPKLSLEESAAMQGMKPNEYKGFQEKVYQETEFLNSKPYQEASDRIAKQQFKQQQTYFDAMKAWNKANDPTIPMPRKEDFAQPMKQTFDMQSTLSEASLRAKKATTSGFGKTQPKQSNFIAESTVEAAAKSSGATTAQVKAQIANQRSAGAAPDLAKATEAIATAKQSKELAVRNQPTQSKELAVRNQPVQSKELAVRSLAELQPQSKELSTRVASRQQPDGMINIPSEGMIKDAMKQQNRVKFGDRIGASGLGAFMDTAQAAQVLTESASRGENAPTALTRAGLSAGAGYATTALASFIPNPYLRIAAQLGGGIAAVVGADKAIDQVVGRNEAKEQKYAKDLSKLDLQATDEKEQWKPFANDSNIAAAYGNSLTAQIQQNLDYRPAARSLANLANRDAIENARYASEREQSIKAGSDAKSKKSLVIEDTGNGTSVGYIRNRGFNATESRVLALQNLAIEAGYPLDRTGKFNGKTLDALEKIGYTQSQITNYIQGKSGEAIGKPDGENYKQKIENAKREEVSKRLRPAGTGLLADSGNKVTGSQLSQALSAERQKQGLSGSQVLDQGTVDSVFRSLAGKSLTDLRRTTKVGGASTQRVLRAGVGLR